MKISSSIRALYRTIGKIIGRQIYDRVANDQFLDSDSTKRADYASEVINTITGLRHELLKNRDFKKVAELIEKLFTKDSGVAVKQFAWILEAYLLLNQSSSASAEVTKPDVNVPDRLLMSKLIEKIRTRILHEEDLEKIFTEDFSVNLVLTAHPTAGIQPDYVYHIKNMVHSVQKISDRIDPSKWEMVSTDSNSTALESIVADIIEEIGLSISHMVRAKPYNKQVLRPLDESANFMVNIAEAWEIIPAKVQALEQELKKYLGNQFRLHADFFRLHSWVARDIDGNPNVSYEEHLQALLQERLHFLIRYKNDVEKLWQDLSDDFTSDPQLPSKTYFEDENFNACYKRIVETNPDIAKPYQAYRVVIEAMILSKIDMVIDAIAHSHIQDKNAFHKINSFSIKEDFIKPLELIRANKNGINTQDIDILIRKANIFSEYGSKGHTRQEAKVLQKLCKYLTALWEGNTLAKTNYIFTEEVREPRDLLRPINFPVLKSKITLQYGSDSEKIQKILLQTFDLLELSELGGIRRLIISMNKSFEDMLGALVITKVIGAFKPSTGEALPWSRMEIVPLTEQISDLRNSYKVTIEALTNKAWNEYLIAQGGRFIKMRGPSDSGKQNGFIASQWEMFRSKQFDTIVVEIFNAYLEANLGADSDRLGLWQKFLQEHEEQDFSELNIIKDSLESFEKFFASSDFNKELWNRAKTEKNLRKIKLINFDGWGEPVERGGGLEFEDTVRCTQPTGSIAYYERTLQGGGAQQLATSVRTKQAMQDFLTGISEIALRKFSLERSYQIQTFVLDPNFIEVMSRLVVILRTKLRNEIFGLSLEDDFEVNDEATLRNYFRHVIKSPLVFLDFFNIASRPTSRSGSKIKEILDDPKYGNSLNAVADNLDKEAIVNILNDIRAIPYAAMFSLLGGNHVSFYGFDEILENTEKFAAGKGTQKKTLIEWIKIYYAGKEDNQELRLIKHNIDSLERAIITSDQDCYRKAHEIIEQATNSEYKSGNDLLILKFLKAQQSTINFIAAVKGYKVKDPKKVLIDELMQNDSSTRDLLIARRNDAAVPRIGIAVAMSKILAYAKENNLNPLDKQNIPINLLDLLRKAFAAGASTFGNGCID